MTERDPGRPPETFLHKVASAPPLEAAEDTGAAASDVRDNGRDDGRSDVRDGDVPDDARGEVGGEVGDSGPIDGTVADDDTAPLDPVPAGPPPAAVIRASEVSPPQASPPQASPPQASPPVPRPRAETRADDEPLLGSAADELLARWKRAASDFVDDPQAATVAATEVVAEAAARLQALIRDRQQTVRASGNGKPDTEALRQAMLTHRRVLDKLLS